MLTGRDTIFVQKHDFESAVRNVFRGPDAIYVKTALALYKLDGETWELSTTRFTQRYVFYNNGRFYETNDIPLGLMTDIRGMARMIPQLALSRPTSAEWDERFFLSVGGALYEYAIPNYYRRSFNGYSIRDIYAEPGLMVVSTYEGIYVNNNRDTTAPYYSNGAFCRLDGHYFLCQDKLYRYVPGRSFSPVDNGSNDVSGNIRKLLSFQGQWISLNTKSINVYDTLGGLTPIHDGFEYDALTIFRGKLYFGTVSGEIFAHDDETVLVADLDTRIMDLYPVEDTLFISTDIGLFILRGEDRSPPVLFEPLAFCVGTLMDRNQTLWISTENGLYCRARGFNKTIPVIPNTEFNRDALAVLENALFAGSIDGLFAIDIDEVQRQLIPKWRHEKRIESAARQRLLGLVLAGAMVFLSGYLLYRRKYRKVTIPSKEKEGPTLTLAAIEADILAHRLATVESMADHYKTNTVQLNRIFKTFDTTPGKFLKAVKIRQAEALLRDGVPMEEVVARVGYSAQYIRKNIG